MAEGSTWDNVFAMVGSKAEVSVAAAALTSTSHVDLTQSKSAAEAMLKEAAHTTSRKSRSRERRISGGDKRAKPDSGASSTTSGIT